MSKDFSPEADFAARRMTKEDFPGRYPYRDFGLKFWEATHTWVKEYVDVSAACVFGAQINYSNVSLVVAYNKQ